MTTNIFKSRLEQQDRIMELHNEILSLIETAGEAAVSAHYSDDTLQLLSFGRMLLIARDKVEDAMKVTEEIWSKSSANGARKNG